MATKRKAVGKTKKAVTGKRKRTTHTKVGSSKSVSGTVGRAKSRKSANPTLAKAKAILNKIDRMEAQRSALNSRALKQIMAVQINAEHKKLKALQRGLGIRL